jgi:hypothetical protein
MLGTACRRVQPNVRYERLLRLRKQTHIIDEQSPKQEGSCNPAWMGRAFCSKCRDSEANVRSSPHHEVGGHQD